MSECAHVTLSPRAFQGHLPQPCCDTRGRARRKSAGRCVTENSFFPTHDILFSREQKGSVYSKIVER